MWKLSINHRAIVISVVGHIHWRKGRAATYHRLMSGRLQREADQGVQRRHRRLWAVTLAYFIADEEEAIGSTDIDEAIDAVPEPSVTCPRTSPSGYLAVCKLMYHIPPLRSDAC